ncbi:MAG: hypothetical protein PVSMB8_00300 [Vulcanimicrobiaceae bacterium]
MVMSANRKPLSASTWLLRLSKVTLADLVWKLAAESPECASCDDPAEVTKVIHEAAKHPWVEALRGDMRKIEVARATAELVMKLHAEEKENVHG